MRRDLLEERLLPVHALADRLDHEVAVLQQRQMLVVVRRLDLLERRGGRGRRGAHLRKSVDRLLHVRVLVLAFRGKLEEQRLHIRVGEVRGDLRAHHTGSEHGRLADEDALGAIGIAASG